MEKIHTTRETQKSIDILVKIILFEFQIGNTPGTRGWSRIHDRKLAAKSRKNAQKSAFVKKKFNKKK